MNGSAKSYIEVENNFAEQSYFIINKTLYNKLWNVQFHFKISRFRKWSNVFETVTLVTGGKKTTYMRQLFTY